ncbi:MAG: sigma-70 family RNA polymerase sigma factor [Lentisphaerae bacterium]|jgi:RNA polymerase sigma-70 factor (ECF subfamily)|nr:sigma-70 family RNA polymerase sigma factor [Lentisphaerota bacterium]
MTDAYNEEAQAIAACRAGTREAFAWLVDRHRDAVYQFAWRMCGNPSDAEDLAQEAFVRAFTRLEQYAPERGTFRNWVLGICANLARGQFRWRQRARAMTRRFAEHEQLRIEAVEAGQASDAGRVEDVSRALDALPVSLRVPVVLKYMEDLSVQEIARSLGIGESAVKMRLARGRERLLDRLKPGRGPGGER